LLSGFTGFQIDFHSYARHRKVKNNLSSGLAGHKEHIVYQSFFVIFFTAHKARV